jgi:nucleotide-binding universal stress UspA family protein
MVRSILVGLDGSSQSLSAMKWGIEQARQADALLVGLAVLDEPTIADSAPMVLGGPPYADPIIYRERMADARRQVEQFLEQFSLRCAEEGVASKVLEDVGLPFERICLEAQRYDIVVLGQKTRFHFETHERNDDTLWKVLKHTPRPVVVVPEHWEKSHAMVVAYDGSFQAARVLSAFQESGFARAHEIHVVCVNPDRSLAASQAERAVDYLRFHEIKAIAHAIPSNADPAALILDQIRALGADLLVMGVYGQPALKEFFLGSMTSALLKESPVPLFLYR